MERIIEVGKKYKHFKGNLYKVLDIVYDTLKRDIPELLELIE